MHLFKKYTLAFFFLFSVVLLTRPVAAADGYEIKFKIPQLRDSTIVLGFYFGESRLLKDSIKLDHNGIGVAKDTGKLEGGIYIVVLPHGYFELLVNDQKFSIETDTNDLYGHMKITGSPDNEMFRDYQLFMSKAMDALNNLGDRMDKNKDNADSTAILKKQSEDWQKQIKDYRQKLMANKDPKLLLPNIIRALSEPDIPEPPADNKDPEYRLHYFKSHLFDNLDFCDERLIRTPMLYGKIKQYLTNLTYQVPDSINIALDTVLAHARCNSEVFKYVLSTFTNYYETIKMMGFEGVFVHLAEKYYLTGQAPWTDSTTLANIQKSVREKKPNLIGMQAHDFEVWDTSYVSHRLYEVKTKYTILAFYDPTCSHCKVDIPKLAHLYDSMKVNSIEVFAVAIESDLSHWKDFVKDNKLTWINVADVYGRSDFRSYYDTFIIPAIYILDETKKIIARKIPVESIADFMHYQLNQKKSN